MEESVTTVNTDFQCILETRIRGRINIGYPRQGAVLIVNSSNKILVSNKPRENQRFLSFTVFPQPMKFRQESCLFFEAFTVRPSTLTREQLLGDVDADLHVLVVKYYSVRQF